MTLSFQQAFSRRTVTSPAHKAMVLDAEHVEGHKTDWDCFKLHHASSRSADTPTTNEVLLCLISG
jgi:hypothetical protein